MPEVGSAELTRQEERFSIAYEGFILYEYEVNDFLVRISEITTSTAGTLALLDKHFNTVNSQREGLRTLLEEIGRVLSGHRSLAVNYAAIRIAFIAFLASIILGVVSVYVAYISQPIILYPPHY